VKLLLTIFTSLFLFGCSGGVKSPTWTPTPTAVPAAPVLTKISLSPAIASIHVGGEQTYTAQGLDQYQNPMTIYEVCPFSVQVGADSLVGHRSYLN